MKIRINNIEFREYTSTKRDKLLYEIVKWDINPYYKLEDTFKNDGYTESTEKDSLLKNNHLIHKSLFVGAESCISIAFVEEQRDGNWELRSVGERMLKLSPEDWVDFSSVYEIGQAKLNKKYK